MVQIGRYFEVKERKSSFLQEMRAGVVAFLTVRRNTISLKWLKDIAAYHDTLTHVNIIAMWLPNYSKLASLPDQSNIHNPSLL